MAPHSSTCAWKIPWMEEPGRLQSKGSLRVGHDPVTSYFHFPLSCIGEGNGNPLQWSCLENPRDGEAGRLPSMGSHRVGHDWSDLAAAAAGVMLIKGNLTKIESGDQKGELSWITTQVQIQEELSIIDLNRRIINRKEQSVIGPDRKRCTLYLLQYISNSANEKLSPPWSFTFAQCPLVQNKSSQLLSLSLSKNVPSSPLCAICLCFCHSLLVLLCDSPAISESTHFVGEKILKFLF